MRNIPCWGKSVVSSPIDGRGVFRRYPRGPTPGHCASRGEIRQAMANYALINGNALETIDLYSEVVRREGLEAVLVRDPEETRRIVSERGRPRLVIADLE